MPDRAEFEALRLELLRGGIANLYVERTLRELADHYEDLERAALAAGCSREEAAQRARAQLGRPDLIAAAILARPELKSWTRRWPTVALCARSAAALGAVAGVTCSLRRGPKRRDRPLGRRDRSRVAARRLALLGARLDHHGPLIQRSTHSYGCTVISGFHTQ